MKISKPLVVSVLFIAAITFSSAFDILAQQNSVELQAKVDAVADANKDVNKPIWFGAGCLLSGLVLVPLPGLYTSCLLPPLGITGTYFYQPSPSPARFIGKAPEYVDVYTSTYKSKRGSIQASMSSAGCLAGGGTIGFTFLAIGFALLDEVPLSTE